MLLKFKSLNNTN